VTQADRPLIDPVCGMTVDRARSAHKSVYEGKEVTFCGARCKVRFDADPSAFSGARDAPAPVPVGPGPWTCPMHPEIIRDGPGACPICGMGLEPAGLPVDGPNVELVDMTRRFWIAAVLTMPVFALAMGGHVTGLPQLIAPDLSDLFQFVLATPVVLWAGYPFFERAVRSVINRSLNMFSLIALGVGAAYADSLAATFAPDVFPAALHGHGGMVPVYYEAAAMITVLVLLGQVLELRARDQTGGAVRALMNLVPKTARRIGDDGQESEITLDRIKTGDLLRIRPGEAVPADGRVIEGASTVDESMVTGESMPVSKMIDAALIGGTINGTGSLIMRAERVGAETMLSRIIHMVTAAQRSRAPIQRMADLVSGWFVPAVIAAALIAFCAWMIWGPPPAFGFA